jgi:sec-independent protein translocase protein TatA
MSEMFSSIGIPGLILILFVILLLFGPKKLPELGRSIGDTLKNFKRSTRDMIEEAEAEAPKK